MDSPRYFTKKEKRIQNPICCSIFIINCQNLIACLYNKLYNTAYFFARFPS